MANLTFTDIIAEVFAHTGLDSADTTNITNVKRWINYVQQDICGKWPWSFMLGREAIATVADYSTGTVSVNAAGTTVTGVGTTFTTTHGDGTYYLQFSSAKDWYRVSARASNTSVTIEIGYTGTANLSGSTFILRKIFYSLSSSCDRIMDVRNWDTPMKLIQADARTIDSIRPNPQSTNSSYGYMTFGYDSSGNVQISPYPFPSDARLFEFRTHKRPVDMVSSSQETPSIPNKYVQYIAWGAVAVGFAFLRKFNEAQSWNAKYEQAINDMKKNDRQSEDYQPMLNSIDSVSRTNWIQLPDSYPAIGGS